MSTEGTPPAVQKTAYTQGHSAAVVASHASRTVENSASFVLPHLRPDFTVVDLGCGPGTITRGFSALVPQGRVVGIDAGEGVVEQARAQAPAAQFPNLTFLVGDVTARLPFADAAVDLVYTSQVLCHLPAPPTAVLAEARRVLKPGGVLALREIDHWTWHPGGAGIDAYTAAMARSVAPTGAQLWGSGRRLAGWAAAAGFDRAEMHVGAGTTVHTTPGETRWWAGVHVARLEGEVGRRFLEQDVVQSQEEIDEMIAALKAFGQNDEAWYVALQGEVICRK